MPISQPNQHSQQQYQDQHELPHFCHHPFLTPPLFLSLSSLLQPVQYCHWAENGKKIQCLTQVNRLIGLLRYFAVVIPSFSSIHRHKFSIFCQSKSHQKGNSVSLNSGLLSTDTLTITSTLPVLNWYCTAKRRKRFNVILWLLVLSITPVFDPEPIT